jgi:hypothetical protein
VRWMVSSAHVLHGPVGTPPMWDPQRVHHAREMGTIVTACGRYAATWTNFYFWAYTPGGTGACADCDRAIALGGDARSGHTAAAAGDGSSLTS